MKVIKKISMCMVALILCFNISGFPIYAVNSIEVNNVNAIGKTSLNTSIYGYNLEDNMIDNIPSISSFTINNNTVNVLGMVDENDENTAFHLNGDAYKTEDGNIVCNVEDLRGTYDVEFCCLEKSQQYNDYILYRQNQDELQATKGNYGLKIYLMKKGTRDISIIEDANVQIDGIESVLANLNLTDYANLNWFVNCFEPAPESVPYNVTSKEYQFVDSVTYYFGSVAVKLGIILTATNDTPTVSNQATFTSKLQHSYYVYSDNPSYNQPARAEGYFRVENINISSTVGQGYYIQQVHWNGSGVTTLSISPSLNLYVGYGNVVGGNITWSTTAKTFNRDNWLNLIDSSCTNTNMPRSIKTDYDNLIIGTPSNYADFSATITNAPNVSDKFKCYQTIWSFDITKKGSFGYSLYKSNQSVTCTSYFS